MNNLEDKKRLFIKYRKVLKEDVLVKKLGLSGWELEYVKGLGKYRRLEDEWKLKNGI